MEYKGYTYHAEVEDEPEKMNVHYHYANKDGRSTLLGSRHMSGTQNRPMTAGEFEHAVDKHLGEETNMSDQRIKSFSEYLMEASMSDEMRAAYKQLSGGERKSLQQAWDKTAKAEEGSEEYKEAKAAHDELAEKHKVYKYSPAHHEAFGNPHKRFSVGSIAKAAKAFGSEMADVLPK